MANKKQLCKVLITVSDTDIDVKFSDWMKVNPRMLDRIRDRMGKEWRIQRAKVVHEDRVQRDKKQAAVNSRPQPLTKEENEYVRQQEAKRG